MTDNVGDDLELADREYKSNMAALLESLKALKREKFSPQI